MAPTDAQKRASDKYNRQHMATLGCKVTKEQAQAFKDHCQSKGSTANKVLRDFVLDSIGSNKPAPEKTESKDKSE